MFLKGVVIALAYLTAASVAADDVVDKLNLAEKVTTDIMDDIFKTWEIDKYPLWLKSMWLPKHSFDHMLAKFEERILEVMVSKKHMNFTISFTGSSVTAGHDSPFQISYPVVTGKVMKPAFEPLGINLVSNNDAMGNNPCMPYDACVATYSGPDADVVHWEQQFNCYIDGDPRMVEQFVRQSRFMPKNPVVIIAGSITPNWKAGDCVNVKPHSLTEEEKKYLRILKEDNNSLLEIFTNENKGDRAKFPKLHEMLKNYPSAGIQSFDHRHYEDYKCLGPYIPNWGDGVASWHPSAQGHKLRAHHYAYLWLYVYKTAVQKVRTAYHKGDKIPDMLKSVSGFLNSLRPKIPLPPPISSTQSVSDDVQCFTAFEPHQDRSRSLLPQVVQGLEKGWAVTQLEQLLDPGIVRKAQAAGYLDQKRIVYGNPSNGPLSIKFSVKKLGSFFVCEAPGVWGKLPNGFDHLWESDARFFIIPTPSSPASFEFSMAEHEKYEVHIERKQIDEICTRVTKQVQPGHYVLSVVPTKANVKVMVSTLLVP